jgi:hypothetical protein
MVQGIYGTSMWAITSGPPFMWSVTVYVGGANVLAEASLSKLVLPYGTGHAKATVYQWSFAGSSWIYGAGIDGPPSRYLPNCNWVQFTLEVNGTYTYAWATGKVFVF